MLWIEDIIYKYHIIRIPLKLGLIMCALGGFTEQLTNAKVGLQIPEKL